MLLSGKLAEEKVRAFADKLKLKITKWKNASEQFAPGDAE
jgi:hypothetical protein